MRKAARDMMEKSEEDTAHLEAQLLDLTTKWDKVCRLSVRKQERLNSAVKTVSNIRNIETLVFCFKTTNTKYCSTS